MLQHAVISLVINRRANRNRLWPFALLVIALLSIWPAGVVLADPVAPIEVRLTQPDGTTLGVMPFGDEWYNGYEYQGYTILLDPASNYWVYAQSTKSGQLVPGPWRVGLDTPPTDLPQHLRDQQALQSVPAMAAHISPNAWAGVSGTQRVLVILTDFTPSTSRGTTEAQWNQLFFDTTPGAKSVRNYYSQASFSKFDLAPAPESYGTTNDGVIAVTLNYAHPYTLTAQDNREISYNALVAADPYIDYASLDTNGNGALENTEVHLMVIVRGYEESYGGTGGACTPNVWGHRGSLSTNPTPPQLDGVWVGAYSYGGGYTQEGEWHEFISDGCDGSTPGHMATIGIMVHELGHDIDWPDLYDTDSTDGSSSAGVGNWSIMAGGSWGWATGDLYSGQTPVLPDAFLKWYQHWITPTQVFTPQTSVAIPNSAQNPAAYLLGVNPKGLDWDFGTNTGTGEYFLVENRQQQGFDAGLRSINAAASGCLIYHIDETRTSSNTANANPTRKLVDVEEADGSPQDMDLSTGGNNGDAGDPWPGSTSNTTFNDTSVPNSNWYDGTTSGIALTNISTAGTGCTVDFSGTGPMWTGSLDSNWDAVDNWTTTRVPTQIDNVVIPSGVTSWPNVNTTASVWNLNIVDGAHLDAIDNATLNVYGNWSEEGSGYFEASAGTVNFAGNSVQAVFAGSNSHFNNLQIGDGTTAQTVAANSDLDINGNVTIQSGAKLAAGSHTLYVGGDWIDNPLGFDPGTGTVIFDGATQTIQRATAEGVAYSSDLSSTTGWTTYDPNGGGWWGFSTTTAAPNTPNHDQHARYYFNANPADDWLFSPGFTLQAGVTYTLRFNYGARSATYPERLAVHIGAARSVAGMATQVFDNNNVINTTWQPGIGTFTPSTTGTYYVGFHAYSLADQWELAVDDLSVTVSDPDLTFYNLTIGGSDTTTLGDNATIRHDLTVNSGVTLTLGTYDVSVEGAVTNNGRMAQTKTINAGGATFLNINNAAGDAGKYWGAIITSTGNMSTTTVVIGGNQNCTTNSGDPLITRCFNISPNTNQNATIRFYYTNAELNGRTFNTLRPWHWNPSWTQAGNNYAYSATCSAGQPDCWLEAQNITSYSPFGLGNVEVPTAVTLRSVTANPIGFGNPIGLVILLVVLNLAGALLMWKHRRSAI